MIIEHTDSRTQGIIRLLMDENSFNQQAFKTPVGSLLTIVWTCEMPQKVLVDDQEIDLPANAMVVFNSNQSFQFEKPNEVVGWQFNRDFYCIIDHDEEVSCTGLLFYGHRGLPIIKLHNRDLQSLNNLLQVFIDEFEEANDNLKTEMLRTILKRLIVKLTRTYKTQLSIHLSEEQDINIVRKFNLLVEQNYRRFHQVQDYSDLLNKSPKTISNLFNKFSAEKPLEVIHNRLFLEAKRMLLYSDKTAKEIAYDLGFNEIPGFSRFFKKYAQLSPSEYRQNHRKSLNGKY